MSSVPFTPNNETRFLEQKFHSQLEKVKASLLPNENILYITNCEVRWGRIPKGGMPEKLDEWRMGGRGFIGITSLRTLITVIPKAVNFISMNLRGKLVSNTASSLEQWEVYHSVLRPVRISGKEFFMIVTGDEVGIECYPSETIQPVLDLLRKAAIGELVRPVIIQKDTRQQTLELIEKLKELRDSGVLSEDEFQIKKAELLARI
jgi:hypothetical protein